MDFSRYTVGRVTLTPDVLMDDPLTDRDRCLPVGDIGDTRSRSTPKDPRGRSEIELRLAMVSPLEK